ncbi:uncharacterized protein NDAI_0D01870 [Naumovozyma dairenensis CBS 421]|uniref:Partial AB-hydrolase lipase domain-containing protein n=1 Tax=Naumovozyma dairenensis (strain ATCC 10597 / BCRC 20456 / CBS 421 / NBRC 0211 / NRRL Y-12639) TaxID=1071378 RepID=G0W9P0_NAUDC|nr:hypothetical protein NDAI_0D01870 [Naumovozyma dairenensis CBS 421]CCD24501.1 hypothetical protein NDAI_0D01870 [Naumovozyma dairenensis CBS 421]
MVRMTKMPIKLFKKTSRRIVSSLILNLSLSLIFIVALYKIYFIEYYNSMSPFGKFITKNVDKDSSSSARENNNTTKQKKNVIRNNNNNKFKEDLNLYPTLNHYYNQYGIEIEEFQLETKDGFIIDLWHLKSKTNFQCQNNIGQNSPVLMIHGLLQSSGSFASNGQNSLAYYMFNSGFDVWLGNNRCGFTPNWNPKLIPKKKRWDWDINEMVNYDLPMLIDHVLKVTNFEKLSIVCHSQGTTQVFLNLLQDKGKDKNCAPMIDKIENVIALAPALYPGPILNDHPIFKLMSMAIDSPVVFGEKNFINIMMVARKLFLGTAFFGFICYTIFNYLFGWNDLLWDDGLKNRHFQFSPVFVSVKLMQWWISRDPNKKSFIKNYNDFFPQYKKWFSKLGDDDTKQKIIPNFLIFIPGQDKLVDGQRVIKHFRNFENEASYKIWYIEEYSHVDILWANDVLEKVGRPILQNMRLSHINNNNSVPSTASATATATAAVSPPASQHLKESHDKLN